MKKIISAKNIKIVRQGTKILKGIDIEMLSNQHLGIIGHNGAGKSFLLQILSADIIPSSGEVTILDQTFGKTNLWNLRKKIGFVSSKLIFWYKDQVKVLDVVASGFHGTFGLPEKITDHQKKRILQVLKFFDIEALQDRFFETLSDGEKRKVLLCRAIVLDPKILIFDEPCQGLDIPTREIFLKDVDKLSKKINIIYVNHHLEELPFCITDIVFLKKGKIFAKGKKDQMLTSKMISDVFDFPLEVVKKNKRFFVQHNK